MKKNTHNAKNIDSLKRRYFLKKSLYSTPTIIALGSLAKPENLEAGSAVPGPPAGRGGILATPPGGLGP